jgi:hypothetical protein
MAHCPPAGIIDDSRRVWVTGAQEGWVISIIIGAISVVRYMI